MATHDIDQDAAKRVGELIEQVKAAGLEEAAKVFESVYWGWLRTVETYVAAHPYVANPEKGRTAISALTVVDYTFNYWGQQIPGTPVLNDEAVLREAAADDEWHRQEDRRMREEY